jgi:hypothetical protein
MKLCESIEKNRAEVNFAISQFEYGCRGLACFSSHLIIYEQESLLKEINTVDDIRAVLHGSHVLVVFGII